MINISDIKEGAKFKNDSFTVSIDKIEPQEMNGKTYMCARTVMTNVLGNQSKYRDTVEELVSFLNEESCSIVEHVTSEPVDLFDKWEQQPENVQAILAKYPAEGWNYEDCKNCLVELNAIGYTYEYGLDACPFNLHKL